MIDVEALRRPDWVYFLLDVQMTALQEIACVEYGLYEPHNNNIQDRIHFVDNQTQVRTFRRKLTDQGWQLIETADSHNRFKPRQMFLYAAPHADDPLHPWIGEVSNFLDAVKLDIGWEYLCKTSDYSPLRVAAVRYMHYAAFDFKGDLPSYPPEKRLTQAEYLLRTLQLMRDRWQRIAYRSQDQIRQVYYARPKQHLTGTSDSR